MSAICMHYIQLIAFNFMTFCSLIVWKNVVYFYDAMKCVSFVFLTHTIFFHVWLSTENVPAPKDHFSYMAVMILFNANKQTGGVCIIWGEKLWTLRRRTVFQLIEHEAKSSPKQNFPLTRYDWHESKYILFRRRMYLITSSNQK